MGIFDKNTDKENADELLYECISEELKPLLEELDKQAGRVHGEVYFMDPDRSNLIKRTAKTVLQFIWRKLDKKIPEYTRNVLDKDFNIMNFKND